MAASGGGAFRKLFRWGLTTAGGCAVASLVVLQTFPGGVINTHPAPRRSLLALGHEVGVMEQRAASRASAGDGAGEGEQKPLDAPVAHGIERNGGYFAYVDGYSHTVPLNKFVRHKRPSAGDGQPARPGEVAEDGSVPYVPTPGEVMSALLTGFATNAVLKAEWRLTAPTREGHTYTLRAPGDGTEDVSYPDFESFCRAVERVPIAPGLRVCGFRLVDARLFPGGGEFVLANGNDVAGTLTHFSFQIFNPDQALLQAFPVTHAARKPRLTLQYGSSMLIHRPLNMLETAVVALSCAFHIVYSHCVFGFTTRGACQSPVVWDGIGASGYGAAARARRRAQREAISRAGLPENARQAAKPVLDVLATLEAPTAADAGADAAVVAELMRSQ